MENEIWKDITGYEGRYQVSNLGRVKSLDRYINHWRGGLRKIKGKIISPHNNKGYLRFMFDDRKKYMIHQLVAMSFLGHTPNGMNITIDHIDNNKLNNKVSNLEIVSCRENNTRRCMNIKKHNLKTGVLKMKSGRYKSQIGIGGMKLYLGTYDTELEASNAYQQKLKELI